MIEEIKKLLDIYYGETRSDNQKQEIAKFIRGYSPELLRILKYNNYEVPDAEAHAPMNVACDKCGRIYCDHENKY
jgi:lysyl-tRNA synthetase class I